jgi:DNA-binding NtrC family response regulator
VTWSGGDERGFVDLQLLLPHLHLILLSMAVTSRCHPTRNSLRSCEKVYHEVLVFPMPTPRVNATELAKLLNEAKQPIYVVDDDLAIVFLNRACREWLGGAAEGVLGRSCAYHSSLAVGGADAIAAALCPPPASLAGEISTATVARVAEDGASIERRGRFLPIAAVGEEALGVLAILDASDRTPDSTPDQASEPRETDSIALHEALRRFRQEAAARFLADRLIGEGPAMRLARRQVELAAASRSSVLLVGPPGSGRRHLAAAIHYVAPGKTVPDTFSSTELTPLDCSLLGGDLLEAAGAAIARAASRGEQAASRTLLFHRIDELPAEVQTRLADFLIRQPIQGRLLATAAEPLLDLARRGTFHPELAALLSTITIELPPLARRRDDLPLLAQLFLEERNATGSRQIGGFSLAALDRLDAYAWPGNLDELSEVVAEAHQRASGVQIEVKDLPERLHLAEQAAAQPRRSEENIVLDEYLGRVERELIRRALARAKGNKAKAARLLGVTRPRLYRRMVQLGLE